MTGHPPLSRSVVIDCFRHGSHEYAGDYAVVAVDVIRATTTAITAVVLGRRCFTVPDLEAAAQTAAVLDNPLLAGELGGNMPFGFDFDNSPAEVARRTDTARPLVLLSSSGTRLLAEAAERGTVYAACLRNYSAQVRHVIDNHPRVAVVGAATRGEFREEDQLCCAWIAEGLLRAGYEPEGETLEIVRRWSGAPPTAFLGSKSVAYLRATGRTDDLDFILGHIDDVRAAFVVRNAEVAMTPLVR